MIKRLKIDNFKNFRNIELNLEKFNVVIGQNASGKSNLIQIFSFIKDIIRRGISDAISYQGGADYICNLSTKSNLLNIEIEFTSDSLHQLRAISPRRNPQAQILTDHLIYKLSIKFGRNSTFKILKDELEIFCSYSDVVDKKKISHNGKIIINKKGLKVTREYVFAPEAGSILQEHYQFFKYSPLDANQLLLEVDVLGFLIEGWYNILHGLSVYDFDPKSLKKPSTRRSPSKLEYDGSNIANILNRIKKDKQALDVFEAYSKDLLGFYKSVDTEKSLDGSFKFTLNENNKIKMPAIFVSDGTVNIFALILVLFLQNNKFTAIEEPERNVHPGLLSKIVSYMKEASKFNQLFITTHNPEILNHVDLSNMFLVIRKSGGYSVVMEPENHKTVQQFIKDMKIGEMMEQNMLGD